LKIKNNTLGNLAVSSVRTRGKAAKDYMVVPGEATLELDDAVWLAEYAEPSAKMLEAGNLEIVEAPAKTDEQLAAEEEAELVAAEALVEKAKKKKAVPKPATK
jgi:hypothetical protein